MKIGLVCPYDFFRQGGVQKLVEQLDKELTARGHDVRIITPRPRAYKGEVPERTIFIGQSAKWNTPINTTLEVAMSLDLTEMEAVLEREHFDILHVHEPEVPILGAQIAARAHAPIVATFHATHPENAAGKSIEFFRVPYARSIYKNLAAMTAVSESAARFVRDWSKQPVTIVPNYVDINYFSKAPVGVVRDPSMILYVGRLEKRKGVKYLLHAFKDLAEHDKEVRLVIAGDGGEREKLEDWVKDNDVPRVTFLGNVDEPTKLKLLHQARLFCSPAIYGESFGIVLLEAMAARVPIVAGDNPGYACVMKDRGLLSLVNVKETEEFARRLELLMNDDGMRKLWLTWAKEEIKQYDLSLVVDQYEKVFKQAMDFKKAQQ
ncbi:MAG: glycosyltransferase [Candidatus Saccharibacteria bacterium]|nr:glycosyltransferase [Candidatus Saccharibacteria bacterium]